MTDGVIIPGYLDSDLRSRCPADGCCFELYGCLPPECGVAPAAVVEALDVLEDGVRELQAGVPALPVEQLGCIRPQNDSATALT